MAKIFLPKTLKAQKIKIKKNNIYEKNIANYIVNNGLISILHKELNNKTETTQLKFGQAGTKVYAHDSSTGEIEAVRTGAQSYS